ncbi:hypothetical protein CLU81_4179 [Flavobacterium sp. 9]|uniref:hypothetical protein n=1 Tax=Flavobacterium sp. 9 TaxID=2035198 RepID=UPI000C375932|nr:hypothetical protein [Flavobacterium sp. 9]PIF33562.1 hypothetical protein CLU81_4179 [Flavobacterium sp. 9]
MKKQVLIFSLAVILFCSCNKQALTEDYSGLEKNIAHPKPPKTEGPPRILFIGNSQT